MNITTDEFIVLCGSARLVRDGRYACDCCEALTELNQLSENQHGYVCPSCEDDRIHDAPEYRDATPKACVGGVA